MRKQLLAILVCILGFVTTKSQNTNGVVAVELPVRNSLVFNRSIINPTFSFVREQNKYLSAYNKRQWVQFNDAPTSYLLAYTGRFGENIGAGITLFQQDYGVMSTYGGIVNFAYNARLDRDLNLTFGLNLSAYSSGINENNIVSNFPDPALANIENNFLIAANPGINFGNTFFDFGVSMTNAFLYNVQTSEMLKDIPTHGVQGHIMYTGYMASRGFFDDSKFTGLIRSEFRNDETIISGNVLLSVPKGFWVQAGYNTKFGASGGVGLNITEEIALEYNFETSLGQYSRLGPSHEITLAYRFKNERFFDYSNQDEVTSLIKSKKYKRPRFTRVVKRKAVEPKLEDVSKKESKSEALAEAERLKLEKEKERLALAEKEEAKRKADERTKREAEALKRKQAEQLKAKQLANLKAQQEAARQERLRQEAAAKKLAEEKRKAEELEAQRIAEQRAKEEAQRLEQERQNALKLAEEKRIAEELKAKKEAERLAEEEKIREKQIKEKNAKREKELDRIQNPKDKEDKDLKRLAEASNKSLQKQKEALERFNKAVELKNENLRKLKEENDLSDQGITVERPKKFVSVAKQNRELQEIKTDLAESIEERDKRIEELQDLYDDINIGDTITNDVVMLYYKRELNRLKAQQIESETIKAELENRLKDIEVRIEFEKRRRIKRAEYDNEDERYARDRSRLQNLKQTTPTSDYPPNANDFDHGNIRENKIQILKNINNVDQGIYMVIAVHETEEKRDDFIAKALSAGLRNINFFYDVNTSKYYIYSEKMNSIQDANNTLKTKGTKPYNTKMTIIKIEK